MVASLKIGIAEDELDTREFYQIVIPEMGHDLLWSARNGAELVELAWRSRPDLLIVDVKMPLLDGLDAVRSVTRNEPLLVIVVSGHHDQETMERAEAEQLMSYLIKPIREADLRAAITIATKRFEELQFVRKRLDRVC
jgi:response regulator NasT